MARLWIQVRRLAPQARTILLTSAPDCGAEAVANLCLQLSSQPQRRFITLDKHEAEVRFSRSAARHHLPEDNFYYIPEVGQLSLEAQKGLLRLLHARRGNPVSVVAATSKDLKTFVATGTFLRELSQALSGVRICIPALSQRTEDLPMLIEQTIYNHCAAMKRNVPQISPALFHLAMAYPWSGNFRELSAVVQELLNTPRVKSQLKADDWTRAMKACRDPEVVSTVRMLSLKAVIHEHLNAVMVACEGKKTLAADVLGISRSCLYRMLDNRRQERLELSTRQS